MVAIAIMTPDCGDFMRRIDIYAGNDWKDVLRKSFGSYADGDPADSPDSECHAVDRAECERLLDRSWLSSKEVTVFLETTGLYLTLGIEILCVAENDEEVERLCQRYGGLQDIEDLKAAIEAHCYSVDRRRGLLLTMEVRGQPFDRNKWGEWFSAEGAPFTVEGRVTEECARILDSIPEVKEHG